MLSRLILPLILFAAPVYAATVPAASCERADVVTAITASSNGDTVTIPAGTCTWTGSTPITVTKAITLKGAGCTLDSDGRPTSCLTVIRDGQTGGALINFTLVANLTTRMTGIHWDGEFAGSAGAWASPERPTQLSFQLFDVAGQITGGALDARRIRIDHCIFDYLNGMLIGATRAYGVIDHNRFLSIPTRIQIYVYATSVNAFDWADARWAEGPNWGGENFLFIENNFFHYDTSHYGFVDSYAGARWVFRYNDVENGHVTLHGTESGGRARGARAVEVYENNFTGINNQTQYVFGRSGAGLVYNNSGTGYTANPVAVNLVNERALHHFGPWNIADGTNPWDKNDAGNPFVTGTVSSATGLTMTVTGAGWGVNDYTGYSIRRTNSCVTVTGLTCAALVISNTSDTITFTSSSGFGDNLNFTAGDTFELNKITEIMDQPGRSGGGLLVNKLTSTPFCTSVGTTATCTITNHGFPNGSTVILADISTQGGAYNGTYTITAVTANTFDFTFAGGVGAATDSGNVSIIPAGWNDQVDDPWYEWNNTEDGASISFGVAPEYTLQIRSGEHYFVETVAPGYTAYVYPHPLNQAEATPGTDGLTAPRNLTRVGARMRVRRVVR